MSKIVIIGAGAMGTAFSIPCLDNNHDTSIVGTHLENDFIDSLTDNKRLHPGLNINIPEGINLIKFENFDSILNSNIDLIVLGISSKGIEWAAEQLSRVYKNKKFPDKDNLKLIEKKVFENLNQKKLNNILIKKAKKFNIQFLNLEEFLCNYKNRTCDLVTPNNNNIYFDLTHTTEKGAKYLGNKIYELDWFNID